MLILAVVVVFVSSFLMAAVTVLVASLILQRKQQTSGNALQLAADFEDGPGIFKQIGRAHV